MPAPLPAGALWRSVAPESWCGAERLIRLYNAGTNWVGPRTAGEVGRET